MTDESKYFLERELWMWRGFAILLLLILAITNVTTYLVDRDQHSTDNSQRARAWATIEANQGQIKDLINGNHEAILTVDDHLRQCSGCHSHPRVKTRHKTGGK